MAKSESLSFAKPETAGYPRWFSGRGCVIDRGDVSEVFVGGSLVGTYDAKRLVERNTLLIQLAEDPKCHLGRLAGAFEVSSEWLRRLRLRYKDGGVDALRPRESGGKKALAARDVTRLEKLFESGASAADAHAKVKHVSLVTIRRARRAWKEGRAAKSLVATSLADAEARTLTLPGIEMLPTTATSEATDTDVADVRGGAFVQHVGTWLMMAMLVRLGLYAVAMKVGEDRVPADLLRVGLDAAVATFTLGEPTLEGARRLRTPTAKLLLQSTIIPSPDALRDLMDSLGADLGGIFMHMTMVRAYLDADRDLAVGERGVFYIDNHMRPYTGKRVIRKGWRMQDKRVRPGITDYYVHDEDGRPLFRIDVPSHDSLPMWMMPIVTQLRAIVGGEDRVLLAFDRGGAFPEAMAELRDEGCEFVTYERAPFPTLPTTAFTESVTLDGETFPFVDARTNLKKGRGRVRRISVLVDGNRQINLLASSTLPAERLIAIMFGRWRQENAFKHGNERWGINQLDARKTVAVDPEQIMPNPARRRLDIERRAANIREGDARCLLARYEKDDPRHQRALRAIEDALEDERDVDAIRPHVPKHARVADTELAGKLRRHDGRRKIVLDTIRIACANAESDLAQMLAVHMRKPREAKHLLANVFRSPGRVHVGATSISVDLAPAASPAERHAIANLLRDVSRLGLNLPGDPRRRKLRFRAQLE